MSDPKKPAASADPTPKDAPVPAPAEPGSGAVPRNAKALIDALEQDPELKLDRSSAALLLAILLVANGDAWAAKQDQASIRVEAHAFGRANPIAYHAMTVGHVLGVVKGLEVYGAVHLEPHEYTQMASALAKAA